MNNPFAKSKKTLSHEERQSARATSRSNIVALGTWLAGVACVVMLTSLTEAPRSASADPAREWVNNRDHIFGSSNPGVVHGPGVIPCQNCDNGDGDGTDNGTDDGTDNGTDNGTDTGTDNGTGTGTGPGGGGDDGDDGSEGTGPREWSSPSAMRVLGITGPTVVPPSQAFTYSIGASDRDHWTRADGHSGDKDDVLTYSWSATAGGISVSANGKSISWTAPALTPETKVCTLICRVNDTLSPVAPDTGTRDDGEPVERRLVVRLSDNTTPLPSKARDWDLGSAISTTAITGNISVAPKSVNTYATEASDSDTWEMEAGTSHDEADEVTYSWSSSPVGGHFVGSTTSKTVQWEAPDEIGTYTLKCIVDDKALLGPLDTGRRDDDSQEETITVTVKRGWTPGTPIGIVEERDAAGVLIKTTHSGRMVAPQDQRFDDEADYLPLNPKVRVGTIVSCSVEAAVDMDSWTKGNKTEQVEDTADKTYTWSCTNAGDGGFVATIGATPTSTATGLTVKFRAPTTATPNGEHITLTCVVDDAPTAVVSPDSGSRDDVDGNILTRTVNIEAFNPSSWAEVKLYKYDPSESTPDHLGAEVTGDVSGGHLRAVVKVQVGGNSKLDDGLDASNEPTARGDSRKMRLRFEECDAHHPEGTNEAAGKNHWNEDDVFHGGDWKCLNGTTWTTSTGPTAANNGNDPILYRRIIDWDTTKGKEYADPDKVLGEDHVTVLSNGPIAPTELLGHNGLHRVLLVKEKKDEAAEAKFRTKTDGVYGDPFDSGPTPAGIDVQNMVIQDVVTSSGNPDYFKYYRYSDVEAMRKPTVQFKIGDLGDPHGYRWRVRIRSTDAEDWTDGILITGEIEHPGIVTAFVNDAEAEGQTQTNNAGTEYAEIQEMGTYTFELSVDEIDGYGNLLDDYQTYRSDAYLPYTMPGYPALSGHGGTMTEAPDGKQIYTVDYYLRDDRGGIPPNMAARALDIKMLAPGMDDVVASSAGSWGKDLNEGYRSKLLHTFAPGEMSPGTYITVFTATDPFAYRYRDHKDKHTLTKNDRKSNAPEIINDSRNGDRVVSAKDNADGLPGGEKALKIKIYPEGAVIKLILKRKPGAGGGASGSAVFANPTTKEVIGDTQTITGQAFVDGDAVAQSLLILGRDVSSIARNMILEVANKDGKVLSATFDGQDPAKKGPWDFTVFKVETEAFIDKTKSIDDILPLSALANSGVANPATLNAVFKANSHEKNLLGHHHLNHELDPTDPVRDPLDPYKYMAYGGIVTRGKILPTNMNSLDFNRHLSRKETFNWTRRKWGRAYDQNGFFNNGRDIIDRAQDDMTDDITDGDEDLFPDNDWANVPALSKELFIWVIDTPSANLPGVLSGKTKQRVRINFLDGISYAGVKVGKPINWFWRSSQENKGADKDQWHENSDYAGDNEVGIGTTLLTPDLTNASSGANFTVVSSTLLPPVDQIPADQFPLFPSTISGTGFKSTLCEPLVYAHRDIEDFLSQEDGWVSVNDLIPYYMDEGYPNAAGTQMLGKFDLGKSQGVAGVFDVTIFMRDVVKRSPNKMELR